MILKIPGKTFLVTLAVIFIFVSFCYALETGTHEAINEYVARNTIKGFSLESYLKNQLGIQAGVKEIVDSQYIWWWIRKGGLYEDKPPRIIPYTRSMNHFHDPLIRWDNAGFKGNFKSAVLWAQDQGAFGSLWGGDWSWKKVRNSFYKGLTDVAKTDRENDFADTFRALGQIMHLVEDVSVPAHTRNDAHVIGYHYELSVDKFRMMGNPVFTDALTRPISFDPSILSLPPNPLASIPIAKIFDIDKYNMPNPDPNVTVGNAIGLSEYTNANFVSEGLLSANFQDFPLPRMSDTSVVGRSYLGPSGAYTRQYYAKNCCGETNAGKGYLLATVDYLDYWRQKHPILSAGLPKIPGLDDNVYKDYASLLIPRAVGYSAGLLNYFFRGDMDMVPDDSTGSGYVIVNNTDEDMNGTFELYYDNGSSDERIRINGWSLSIGKKISGNNKSTNITFTKPDNMKEDGQYMLVFRGKLGSEGDAVAGRSVELKGGEYVFLVSAYDHSTAAFKIKTTNNQYQLTPVSKNITITFSDTPSTLLTIQSHPNKKEHVAALPWYSYDYSGNLITNYQPNIANYGKKIPYLDYLGYTHYVTVGFPQAYIPKNFDDDESPYIWDAGLTYGEWTYTKVGNYYTLRLASYIHGRRPFSVVDNKLVAKNISIRKNNDYTYYGDDYSGPFHIQYKDASGGWIRGVDLPFKGGARTYLSEGIGITYHESSDSSSPSNGEWIQHVAVTGQIVNGPIISEGKDTPVDYFAVVNKNETIHTTTDLSETITMAAEGALATINTNSESTKIWWRQSVPGWYDEHCNNFIEKEKIENQMNYLEFRDHSSIASSVNLYIDDNIIHAFGSRAEQAWGEWNLYSSDWIKTKQWNPPDCWLYEHSLISTESSHDAGIAGPTFTIPVPGGTYTGFSSDSEHSYKGETLGRVMDYDYTDSGQYIIFYEYYEHNSVGHGKQLRLGKGLIESAGEKSVGAFGFGSWSGGYQDYSYYDLTTKYRLVYKTENIAIIDIDVSNHSTDERYSDVYGIDENYLPIEERWQKAETSGSRITGISCQISGNSMVYTYSVEQSRELTDKVIWEFSKRVIGIINISDKSLPIGYRQEFEITGDNAGNVNPNFNFSYLAAIGVTR